MLGFFLCFYLYIKLLFVLYLEGFYLIKAVLVGIGLERQETLSQVAWESVLGSPGRGLIFLVSALLAFVRRLVNVLLQTRKHGKQRELT